VGLIFRRFSSRGTEVRAKPDQAAGKVRMAKEEAKNCRRFMVGLRSCGLLLEKRKKGERAC